MSLLLITNPPTELTLSSQWGTFVERSGKHMIGHGLSLPLFSLINWDTGTIKPEIAKGSIIEVGGSFYQADADTTLTDEGGLSDGTVYIKLVPGGSGAYVTPTLTSTSVPVWDAEKGGWYTVNDKFLPYSMTKTGTVYTAKNEYIDQNKLIQISGTGALLINVINTDTINERTGAAGVDIENVLLKDGDISLKGATDADKNIEFASDADILWDESEDEFYLNKGLKLSKTGNYGVYGQASCYGVFGCSMGNQGVSGKAVCQGVHGCATVDCGVSGCALRNYGVYGYATTYYGVYGHASANYGVFGKASRYGVFGCSMGNQGVSGEAVCQGVHGCATVHCGVSGCAGTYGVYGCAAANCGVFGRAYNWGVFGCATNVYPVAGNGAYFNTSTKYLKQPSENICLSACLLKNPLGVYKWRWEDSNQRGFDNFVAPYAEDLQKTFGLTERNNGYYTMDGIALGLGIELLQEIQFLKKRIKHLEEKV